MCLPPFYHSSHLQGHSCETAGASVLPCGTNAFSAFLVKNAREDFRSYRLIPQRHKALLSHPDWTENFGKNKKAASWAALQRLEKFPSYSLSVSEKLRTILPEIPSRQDFSNEENCSAGIQSFCSSHFLMAQTKASA